MRTGWLTRLVLFVFAVAAVQHVPAAHAQLTPDGTPQLAPVLERLAYTEPTDQLLTYYWPLVYEIDQLADPPTPDQVKASPIRRLILDYRLIMDAHAYAYDPGFFDVYREALDDAYEAVGEYKDLFDIQAIDNQPIDPRLQKIRLARMDLALAPLRLGSFREDLKEFAYSRAPAGTTFPSKDLPRLWQIAGVQPRTDLDDAGNTAALGIAVLQNLINAGLQVDDILDPAQEAHFHDVRKALRSVLVLVDMYPSLAQQVGPRREPLARLVTAYGRVNDRFIAYRFALASGQAVPERAADLVTSFQASKTAVNNALQNGALQAYIEGLAIAVSSHGR